MNYLKRVINARKNANYSKANILIKKVIILRDTTSSINSNRFLIYENLRIPIINLEDFKEVMRLYFIERLRVKNKNILYFTLSFYKEEFIVKIATKDNDYFKFKVYYKPNFI